MTTGNIRECEERTNHAQVAGTGACWCGYKKYPPAPNRTGLVGIEVHAGGRWKFIGKVGTCPANYESLPTIAGRRIFYREGSYKDNVSHKTAAFGVDTAAWQKAVELGATIFVHWCTDTRQLLVVDKWTFEKKGFRLDLGEAPELRVKLKDIVIVEKAARIRLGFTTNTIRAGYDPDADEQPIQRELTKTTSPQKGLFDD